jgi:hypothetical protein
MLVCDPTDRSPKFVEPDHVGKLTELRSLTFGAVAACEALDADVPTIPALGDDLEAKRQAFAALYESESKAAEHLVGMLRQVAERAADFERGVRDALASGKTLPVPSGSEALVAKVIGESREARLAAFPDVEQAASDFVDAARGAAWGRVNVAAHRLRKRLEACAPIHAALQDAENRLANLRVAFDDKTFLAAATAAGLLENEQ